MRARNSRNRQKIIVDDIISILLLLMLVILVIINQLIALMALIVYPIFSLLIYGIIKLTEGLFKLDLDFIRKIIFSIIGVASILFSLFIINLLFYQSRLSPSYIIYFIAIPVTFIGIAAIMKGILIKNYNYNYRIINIIVGIITLGAASIAFMFAEEYYIFNMISLFTTIFLNAIFRSALYLSEYKLSLKNLKNFKVVFNILNNEEDILEEFEDSLRIGKI
ncbi:MAG: hypothetical protein ACFFD5_02620 [Candidatus Thorarchaeota archaeon]